MIMSNMKHALAVLLNMLQPNQVDNYQHCEVHHLMSGNMKIPLETTLMRPSPRQTFSMQSTLCKAS